MRPAARVRRSAEILADGTGEELLSADERARWRALRLTVDRDDFLAARTLTRRLLGSVDPALTRARFRQQCDSCAGPHGRPAVVGRPDLYVSWAHAKGVVAAVVARAPVGVDVERLDRTAPPFPDATGELADWLRWCRMEALIKRGDGTLDTGLQWPLAGPAAPEGVPVATLLPGTGGMITDRVDPDGGWVATVAGSAPAAW